jgi:hypothetical protein
MQGISFRRWLIRNRQGMVASAPWIRELFGTAFAQKQWVFDRSNQAALLPGYKENDHEG